MNDKFYETSFEFRPNRLSSTSKIRLRFRCKGSNVDSQVYLDEVDFSGIQSPSFLPSQSSTIAPTIYPSSSPILASSFLPTVFSSNPPSILPSLTPSKFPTSSPSFNPNFSPSIFPTVDHNSSPPSFSLKKWTSITFDSFENGWGNYKSGGSHANVVNEYSTDGYYSARINYNRKMQSSFFHSNYHTVILFSSLRVQFWFYARNMRDGNSFLLEYSSNDTDDWTLVRKLKKDIDFMNDKFYETSIEFYPTQLSLTSKIRLRFRCKGSNVDSQVYVDEVDFSGIQNSSLSPSQSSTIARTIFPSSVSSLVSSSLPTVFQSNSPSIIPTLIPSFIPTSSPSFNSKFSPSIVPTVDHNSSPPSSSLIKWTSITFDSFENGWGNYKS